MKCKQILSLALSSFLVTTLFSTHLLAQSTYDKNGNVKSIEQRRYEESERNRAKVSTPSSPAKKYAEASKTKNTTARRFSAGVAHIEKVENGYGFIARDGNGSILEVYEDYLRENFGEYDLYGVKKGGKWGFISPAGNTLIAFQYDTILTKFQYFGSGMYSEEGYNNAVATVVKDSLVYTIGRYGSSKLAPRPYVVKPKVALVAPAVINATHTNSVIKKEPSGELISTLREELPLTYSFRGNYKDGYAMVTQREKYGFIDKEGKVIIPLIYEKTSSFVTNGYVAAKLSGKWGFLNMANKIIVPFIYDEALFFYENRAAVKLKDSWGYVDDKGTVKVPFKYSRTFRFSNGYAPVNVHGRYGFVDLNGVEVVPPIYDDVYSYKKGVAKVVLNGKIIFVDSTGKVVPEK